MPGWLEIPDWWFPSLPGWIVVGVNWVIIGLILLGGWGFTFDRVKEACCARCRYPVAGLPGATCPECGSDLSGRSTRQPGARIMWRPPIAVAVVCRSVVVAAVGAIAIRAAVEEYPVLASHASAQASGGNGLFSVQAAGSGTGDVNPYGQGTPRVIRIPVVATLHGPRDFTAGLVLKDASGRAEYQGPSGLVEVAHDLSDGDILAWMQAAGIDRSRATAEREAAALRALLWHLLADGTDLRLTEPSGVFVGLDSVDVDAFKFIRPHGGAMACILIPLLGVWLALLNGLRGKRKQPTENHPESA